MRRCGAVLFFGAECGDEAAWEFDPPEYRRRGSRYFGMPPLPLCERHARRLNDRAAAYLHRLPVEAGRGG